MEISAITASERDCCGLGSLMFVFCFHGVLYCHSGPPERRVSQTGWVYI